MLSFMLYRGHLTIMQRTQEVRQGSSQQATIFMGKMNSPRIRLSCFLPLPFLLLPTEAILHVIMHKHKGQNMMCLSNKKYFSTYPEYTKKSAKTQTI